MFSNRVYRMVVVFELRGECTLLHTQRGCHGFSIQSTGTDLPARECTHTVGEP